MELLKSQIQYLHDLKKEYIDNKTSHPEYANKIMLQIKELEEIVNTKIDNSLLSDDLIKRINIHLDVENKHDYDRQLFKEVKRKLLKNTKNKKGEL